jgi:hypothetical protein
VLASKREIVADYLSSGAVRGDNYYLAASVPSLHPNPDLNPDEGLCTSPIMTRFRKELVELNEDTSRLSLEELLEAKKKEEKEEEDEELHPILEDDEPQRLLSRNRYSLSTPQPTLPQRAEKKTSFKPTVKKSQSNPNLEPLPKKTDLFGIRGRAVEITSNRKASTSQKISIPNLAAENDLASTSLMDDSTISSKDMMSVADLTRY